MTRPRMLRGIVQEQSEPKERETGAGHFAGHRHPAVMKDNRFRTKDFKDLSYWSPLHWIELKSSWVATPNFC